MVNVKQYGMNENNTIVKNGKFEMDGSAAVFFMYKEGFKDIYDNDLTETITGLKPNTIASWKLANNSGGYVLIRERHNNEGIDSSDRKMTRKEIKEAIQDHNKYYN